MTESSEIKFAEYIANELANLGITHVFGLPGGQAMHLMDAVDRHPKLRYVTALHEQAASFMAIGYAREHGTPAACLVTTGPGGTNAITGLAGAWLDSIPVLFISGQFRNETLLMSHGLRQSVLQQMFPIDLVKPMTKFAALVADPINLKPILKQAIEACTGGRKGPVWLDIPLDIQATKVDSSPLEIKHARSNSPELNDFKTLLRNSNRPVILAGHGVRLAEAVDQLRTVSEKFKIPVLTTINGMDLIEDNFKFFYGRPNYWGQREANFIVQNSDLVISIGAGLHLETTGFNPELFAREAAIYIVDIDPNEISKSYLQNVSGWHGDANEFLFKFSSMKLSSDWGDWIKYCDSVRQEFKFSQFPSSAQINGLSMYDVIEQISEILPTETTIIYGNAGGHFTTAVQCFRVKKNQRLISSIGIGAMGASIPMAIGAAFASPNKRIVAFTGDGGIQFNIQEISTLVGHKLPIHIFVFENAGYASLRSTQRRYFDGRLISSSPESDLFLPDLNKVISSLGLEVDEVFDVSEVAESVQNNLSKLHAATIFHINPETPIQPRLGSTLKANGNMVSDPLEDLSPHLPDEEFNKWMIISGLRD